MREPLIKIADSGDSQPEPGSVRPRRRRFVAGLVGLLVLTLVIVGIAVKLRPADVGNVIDKVPSAMLDTDHDGLSDREETLGWRTQDGSSHRTDPRQRDNDEDGLTDGEEAGPASRNEAGEVIYAGRSDPTLADTDDDGLGDGVETGELGKATSRSKPYLVSNPLAADSDGDRIGDGDEYFLDMNPLLSDTDDDGLLDPVELRFGSDPTLANPDDDHYADKQEYARKSNPLSYDLTGNEKVAASKGGLEYGDCDKCALNAGLRIEQVESVEYLTGHFVSGVAGYGDLRDFALNIWEQKFLAAGIAALGLLPFIGDSTKAITILAKFAKRGDRAEQAVETVTEKLPLSESDKRKILDRLPSRTGRPPRELRGGKRNYVVYKCESYVGITKDFPRRQAQHRKAGRTCDLVLMAGLRKLQLGEARAVEQACINLGRGVLENKRNSISPDLPYQQEAVDFGLAALKKAGETCPVTAPRPMVDLPAAAL